MAYFTNQSPEQPHQQIFNAPIPEDDPYAEDEADADMEEPLTDAEYAEQEEQENRRSRYRVYAGICNFSGVIAGALVILVVIGILISIVSWVIDDMSQSFTVLQSWFGAKG